MSNYAEVFKVGEVYNCKVTAANENNFEVQIMDGIGNGVICTDIDLELGKCYKLMVIEANSSLKDAVFSPTIGTYLELGAKPEVFTAKIVALGHTNMMLDIRGLGVFPFKRNEMWLGELPTAVLLELDSFKVACNRDEWFYATHLQFKNGESIPLYDWEAKSKWESKYKTSASCFCCGEWQVGKTYALEFNNGWREIESGKYAEIINPAAITSRAGFVLAGLVDIAGGVPKFEVLKSFKLDK